MKQIGFGGRDTENRKWLHAHKHTDVDTLHTAKGGKEVTPSECR